MHLFQPMPLRRSSSRVRRGASPAALRTLWTSPVASLLSIPSRAVRGPALAFIEQVPRAAGGDPRPPPHVHYRAAHAHTSPSCILYQSLIELVGTDAFTGRDYSHSASLDSP